MKIKYYIRLTAVLAIGGLLMPQTLFSEDKRFVQGASRDTISWGSVEKGQWRMIPRDTDIERPGEQMGLIGPIIAHGGQGKETYIAVYDPEDAGRGCVVALLMLTGKRVTSMTFGHLNLLILTWENPLC